MERLTRKTKTGNYKSADKTVSIRQVYDKMGVYEDAEEKGLLLRLPCKVGSTVYLITSKGKIEPRTADAMFLGVLWDEYGKEWFLSQEEAEQALKQMGEKRKL